MAVMEIMEISDRPLGQENESPERKKKRIRKEKDKFRII
jgi:hypothetical protein